MNKELLMVKSFELAVPEATPLAEPLACAATGERVTEGVLVKKLIKPTTSDIGDTFGGQSGYVSPQFSACFASSELLRGNLLALPERGLRPFISQESADNCAVDVARGLTDADELLEALLAEGVPKTKAKQRVSIAMVCLTKFPFARPSWRDVVNTIEPGTKTVAIVTEESKRRLWTAARLSVVGQQWQLYLHANSHSRNVTVDIFELRKCLRLVETVYRAGFNKYAIEHSLYGYKLDIPFEQRVAWDNELNQWRGSDEFLLSLVISQKGV